MDVAMLSHSISNILQWMNSPKPLAIDDIKQLETNLNQINEKVQKQSDSEWLQKVKDVVIDLNDLIEDVRYKEDSSSSSKSLIMTLSVLNVRNPFKATPTHQVKKATEELKRLVEEVPKGEQQEVVRSNANERRKFAIAYAEFEKITMLGRENEKKEIIDQLLNMNNSDVVIVIAGVPGIGKTKLASLVCEDEKVKAKFGFQKIGINDLRENFDVESIAKRVTTTKGKRLLLLLDDLRVEIQRGDLEMLQKELTKVIGSRTDTAIVITTRSNMVANTIAAEHVTTCGNQVANNIAAIVVLKLQGLNQEESWSLFQCVNELITSTKKEEQSSTNESESKPEPEREIVRDYGGGVPLLIVIIAMVIKKNHSGGGGYDWIPEALQMLKCIYYDDLPTYQKLCFAYCSLFPEDYLIDAERLIQLWSAEGFLTIHSDKIPEQQFGRDCFDYFVPLVFHQVEEENKYRMNPLMHKLAKLVATNCDENIIVDSMGERVRSRMLRASFDYSIDLLCGIPDSMFKQAKKLRTILMPYNSNNPRLPHEIRMTTSTCEKIFNNFISLRVLDMHDLGIKTVPSSIEEVKYLRYLDLSNNNMEKLPSCITNLIHLQTLKLSQCHVLKELPKDIGDLSSLNHLDIEGCLDLTHMPTGITKLTSLQTLSLFVASNKEVTGGLRSLVDLNNLKGHLEISHLEQVKFSPSKEAAKDEFMKNKQHLEFLTLRWEHEEKEKEKEDKDKKLLDYLAPHEKLRVLFVVGYNGKTLSDWFGSLKFLVKFTLNNCPECKFLPPLDQLENLKVLQLRRLDSLKFIAKIKDGGSSSSTTTLFFKSLKELTISDCPKLESWWGEYEEPKKDIKDIPSFSCISKLNIKYCPQLACMPLYPDLNEELVLVESNAESIKNTIMSSEATIIPFSKLKSMVIERIEHSPPKDWIAKFTSLQKLHIRDCFTLKSLPQGFKSLSSLQTLTIERCQQLDLDISKDEWKGLKSLHSLTLRTIPKLKSLPQGLENVNSLKELRLYDCSGLTSLSENIGNLTSLEQLDISECRSLESLPKGMKNMKSLHTLIIKDCPLLLPRCQQQTGDDWPQIAKIKKILLK